MPETYDCIHNAGPDKEMEVKSAHPAQSLEQPEVPTSNVQQHPKNTGIISKYHDFLFGTNMHTLI